MHHVLLWCVCLCVGVCTVFLGCLSQTGWCPSDLCKHYRDWVLPPADDTLGGVQLRSPHHLETFKLVSPRQHTTTFCCTKTKNTTFSNVIMLLCVSLKLVHSHLFSLRRGGNYICICVSLCGVVMPPSWFFFVLFVLGFFCWGGFVVGLHGRVGWSEDCHITPVDLIVCSWAPVS